MHLSYLTSRIVQRSIANTQNLRTSQLRTYQTLQSYAVIKSPDKQSITKSTTSTTTSKNRTKRPSAFSPNKSGMRIATLQFGPSLGKVENNIKLADKILRLAPLDEDDPPLRFDEERPAIEDLRPDILVLPEMAFSGYNFSSLEAIRPYLEVQGKGPTALWAQRTARRLKCKVCVGYPEIYRDLETSSANDTEENGSGNGLDTSPAKMYNSMLVVDETGQIIHNYRKRFLYYTDESWASEGEAEWSFKSLDFPTRMSDASTAVIAETANKSVQIPTTFGICMDINPYKFEAPFDAYEFAHRVLDSQSHLVIISAAWLTNDVSTMMVKPAHMPDAKTFQYWLHRFWPLIEKGIDYGDRQIDGFASPTDSKVIIVFANRMGLEDGGPECVIPFAAYAGTSTILAITQKKDSPELDVKMHCWGIMGARMQGIYFADTESEPEMTFTLRAMGDNSD